MVFLCEFFDIQVPTALSDIEQINLPFGAIVSRSGALNLNSLTYRLLTLSLCLPFCSSYPRILHYTTLPPKIKHSCKNGWL